VTNYPASATNGFYIANDTATFADIVNGSLTHRDARTFSREEYASGVGFGCADGTSFSTIGTDRDKLFPGVSQVIRYWNVIEIALTGIQPISPWSRTLSATGRRYLAGTTTPVFDPVNTAEIVAIKPTTPDGLPSDIRMSKFITYNSFNKIMYLLIYFLF
jgi:hypothetical protein